MSPRVPPRDLTGAAAGTHVEGTSAFRRLRLEKGIDPDLIPDGAKSEFVLAGELLVVRPADLLTFSLKFHNMRRGDHGLEPDGTAPAHIVMTLPPQSIAEQAFFLVAHGFPVKPPDPDVKNAGEKPSRTPVGSRIAGTSRLVFNVPDDVGPIGFTLEAVLEACTRLPLRTARGARPRPTSRGRWDLFGHVRDQIPGATFGSLLVESRRRAVVRAWQGVDVGPLDDFAVSPDDFGRGPVDPTDVAEIPHPPERPLPDQTELELPFRLLVSPHRAAAWAHAPRARVSPKTGRTELWHTRLATRAGSGEIDENDRSSRTVRALWARDAAFDPASSAAAPPHADPEPFRTSLTANDRHQLVHLTSNYARTGSTEPVDVERLELSALGATIDWRGAWSLPAEAQGLGIESWIHRASTGRDHYVRVAYAGLLYPFGHRASLVKITERRFHDGKGNTAYLRQRMFIVVTKPEKELGISGFTGPNGENWDHQLPFRSARITTLVTPDLDPPGSLQGVPGECFWPRVKEADVRFAITATDAGERLVEFTVPLLFVEKTLLDSDRANLESVRKFYNDAANAPRRRVGLGGSLVAFANAGEQPDATTYETDELELSSELPEDTQEFIATQWDTPRFVPVVARARVAAQALRQLAGADQPLEVSYTDTFVRNGFGNGNPDEEMLAIDGSVAVDFTGQAQRSGALVTPNLELTTLSRRHGPKPADWPPSDTFGDAKLFGSISLWSIIDAASAMPKFIGEALGAVEMALVDLDRLPRECTAAGMEPSKHLDALLTAAALLRMDVQAVLQARGATDLPKHVDDVVDALDALVPEVAERLPFASEGMRRALLRRIVEIRAVVDGGGFSELVDDLARGADMVQNPRARLEWQPRLKPWPQVDPIFAPTDVDRCLTLSVEVAPAADGVPRQSVRCSLVHFDLHLIGQPRFVSLHFNRIEFSAQPGQKTDIDVDLGRIDFGGPLAFVDTLRSVIPLDGFSDPPAIDVSEEGIRSGFSVGLPDLAIGAFALQNLSLGASLAVPFVGKDPLSVRLHFCEREHPCSLTVMAFGGGFFFAITLSPHGLVMLEAAIEFGASLAINFGVASGGVEIKAGIYFKLDQTKQAELTGYLRIRGEVDVLGLMSASIEMRMELSYKGNKCVGRAVIIVEVEVLCFSAAVALEAERKFAGAAGDPTFEEQLSQSEWADYCGAFA